MLGAFLEESALLGVAGDALVLSMDELHRAVVEESSNQTMIAEELTKVFGRQLSVRCTAVVESAAPKAPTDADVKPMIDRAIAWFEGDVIERPGQGGGKDRCVKSFGDMVKQAQKMQRKMDALQEELEQERFESSAGGDAVTAVVDGKQRLKELKIDPKALEDGDVELLEDLIITAVGEAQRVSEAEMNERMGKITGGMNLPF